MGHIQLTMTEKQQRLHATVDGRVQGVSFRYYTVLRAKELGVNGWVSNLDDGSVEVMAEGMRESLENLLDFLRSGPLGAHVTNVTFNWLDAKYEFKDFNVR